jgi:hypothetical protein
MLLYPFEKIFFLLQSLFLLDKFKSVSSNQFFFFLSFKLILRSLLCVLSFSIFVFFNFTLVFLSRSVLKSVFLQIDYFSFISSCLLNLFYSSFLSFNIYLCYRQFLIFFSKHFFFNTEQKNIKSFHTYYNTCLRALQKELVGFSKTVCSKLTSFLT